MLMKKHMLLKLYIQYINKIKLGDVFITGAAVKSESKAL